MCIQKDKMNVDTILSKTADKLWFQYDMSNSIRTTNATEIVNQFPLAIIGDAMGG